MKSLPNLRRVGCRSTGTLLVFAVVLGRRLRAAIAVARCDSRPRPDDGKEGDRRNWPLFGGSVQRNLVNLVEKNIPTKWERAADKKEQNVKWVAEPRHQGLRRPHHLRRQDLRWHQQPRPAQ